MNDSILDIAHADKSLLCVVPDYSELKKGARFKNGTVLENGPIVVRQLEQEGCVERTHSCPL